MLYILVAHRLTQDGGTKGVYRLAMEMMLAWLVVTPIGWKQGVPAFVHPMWLLAGFGVGFTSVVPYVTDQLAMARLPRRTATLYLSFLPSGLRFKPWTARIGDRSPVHALEGNHDK